MQSIALLDLDEETFSEPKNRISLTSKESCVSQIEILEPSKFPFALLQTGDTPNAGA